MIVYQSKVDFLKIHMVKEQALNKIYQERLARKKGNVIQFLVNFYT